MRLCPKCKRFGVEYEHRRWGHGVYYCIWKGCGWLGHKYKEPIPNSYPKFRAAIRRKRC